MRSHKVHEPSAGHYRFHDRIHTSASSGRWDYSWRPGIHGDLSSTGTQFSIELISGHHRVHLRGRITRHGRQFRGRADAVRQIFERAVSWWSKLPHLCRGGIVQIAGDENDPRRLGHLLDHEIRQEEMTEKVQLKSTLKAVFAELQRFGFHVDAAGVQDESVNGRN